VDKPVSSLERLVFFSDAVFSIAITLLAINIRVPNVEHDRLAAELRHLLPSIGVYVLTFVVVGAYWAAHHRMYRRIVRFDYMLVWLNMLVLLCVAFLPVPNAILARYYDSPPVVLFYAASLIATSISMMLLWRYATANRRLITDDVRPQVIREVFRQNLEVITLAVLAMGIGYWSTGAAFALLVAYAGVGVVMSIVDTRRESELENAPS
jgi:TMEM175 potassium channel family protein